MPTYQVGNKYYDSNYSEIAKPTAGGTMVTNIPLSRITTSGIDKSGTYSPGGQNIPMSLDEISSASGLHPDELTKFFGKAGINYQAGDKTNDVSPGATSPTDTSTPPNASTTTKQAAPAAAPYTIQAGDTLSGLAQKYGTNIQALMAANPSIKNPDKIFTGNKLTIPGAPTGTGAAGAANDYQNKVLGAVSKVTNQSDVAAVGAAAASVPYGDSLPPAAATTVDGLIGTISKQITELTKSAPVSLVDQYKELSKSLGIDDLQTQYMNLNNIINGTEGDIRAEVTKAGGFMSDSQVLSLAGARNKTLILQANGLQALIAQKQSTLDTLSSLSAKDQDNARTRVEDAIGLETKLADMQTTMQTHATDGYNKIVANVGYKGLAGALAGDPYSQALAEKSLMLPAGTLSNPAALSKLDTYREQTIAQGQQKINISVGNAASLASSRDALTLSRYASAANSVIKALYPTNKNPIQVYNNSAQAINRVDAAYEIASDPKNKNKAASDLDLLDSYISIARQGQPINEAQVETLLSGLGVSAKFDVASQKITGTATLDNGTRKSISTLSHSIYDGQKKLADQAVGTINARLTKAGVPSDFLFTSPEEIGDTSQYSGGSSINGQHYNVGETASVGGITLTAQADGNFHGSDGHTYDSDGNEIN